jgi:type II secretory pathway component GspD/PulD (secretin)
LTSLINPVSDKGVRVAPPVPFTQFLQEPKIISRDFAATANLDDNATVLLYGGKATIEESVKQPIPVLVGVPLMAEFFKVQKKTTATNHMLMLVTTKIVSPEIVAASCAECARCDPKLAKLLSDYNRACKEGKTEDARRLAIECLVVDPTCFGKK